MLWEMNTIRAVVFLAAGLVILWKCAELLVTGAVGLAERLGVSALVIGLTIVAMGTSAPEAAASIAGVLRGAAGGDIAVGNVYGSNIANLALVGGLIALIHPLRTKSQTLRGEIPVMLLAALLLWPFLRNWHLSRLEGIVLLVVFAAFILTTVYTARRARSDAGSKDSTKAGSSAKSILFCVIGLAGLALGAKTTVEGAVFLGRQVGLSEGVIALTVIAFGTSLPELVTCVIAAIRRQHAISVGTLVGSNIFNTLLVTGGAAVVRPFYVGHRFAGGPDYWIMIAVGAAFAAIAILGRRVIGRLGGAILLCGYLAYITYLLAFSG
jgi:cation:H+ antiporter